MKEELKELERRIMVILQYAQATMSDKVKMIAELIKEERDGNNSK